MNFHYTKEIALELGIPTIDCIQTLVELGFLSKCNSKLKITETGASELGGDYKLGKKNIPHPAWPWPNSRLEVILKRHNESRTKTTHVPSPIDKAIFPKSDSKPLAIPQSCHQVRNAMFEFYSKKFGRYLPYDSQAELRTMIEISNDPRVNEIRSQEFCIHFHEMGKKKMSTYHPDFIVQLNDQRIIIVEVFSNSFILRPKYFLRRQMLEAFAKRHGLGYLMINEDGNSIDELTHLKVNPLLCTLFAQLAARGYVQHSEYQLLLHRFPHSLETLIALAYSNQLTQGDATIHNWNRLEHISRYGLSLES